MTEEQFLKKIGKTIKKIRTDKKVSQIELAVLCNFEKSSMSRIESGQTNATSLTLRKIALALNVSIVDFFNDY